MYHPPILKEIKRMALYAIIVLQSMASLSFLVFASLCLATCGEGPASYSLLETQPPCLPKSLPRSLPYIPVPLPLCTMHIDHTAESVYWFLRYASRLQMQAHCQLLHILLSTPCPVPCLAHRKCSVNVCQINDSENDNLRAWWLHKI